MKVRFVDAEGTEYSVADLDGVPRKGDTVVVVSRGDITEAVTVLARRWVVPSSGDPPKTRLRWNLEVVVKP